MRSQVFPPNPCLASANSPTPLVEQGLRDWWALAGGDGAALVLGLPW